MEQSDFLYKKLARELEGKIQRGEFKTGEKLPSLRQMHRKLGCSLSTVYQAYTTLETTGLIEARPKSGFIISPKKTHSRLPPRHHKRIFKPGPVQISGITADVVKASLDPNLVPLGASVISPKLLPHKHLNRITREILASDPTTSLPYAPPEGLPEMRRLIARRLTGVLPQVFSDDVLITNGCMEAVALALNLLVKPGDLVAVETPTHFGFLHLLNTMNIHAVGVPTDPQHGVLPASLAAVIKKYTIKACLLIPNFHNPLGALMPDEHKKEIVQLTGKHNIPVIEDDIYGELYFNERRPPLLKQYDTKELVITCSSVSKSLAAGFRVGWCVSGKRFKDELSQLKSAFSLCSPSLQQNVLSNYLSGGGYDRYLRSLRTKLRHQLVDTALAVERYFPASTRFTLPEGGNMLWIELPQNVNGVKLYQQALEKGVSIVPGQAFSSAGEFANFIRISATSPFDERVKEGIKILGELVSEAA